MSRIGKAPISIPNDVTVSVGEGEVMVVGPKGRLQYRFSTGDLTVDVVENEVLVGRKNEQRQTKALHGFTRSWIANMVTGVTNGFEKRLELVGTGYRVRSEGEKLVFSLGYSHPIEILAPSGIQFRVEGTNLVIVSGIDKQLVGQVAADIRALRKPEPYKGKGIRYLGEVIRRKAGKAAKAAAQA